MLIRAMQHPGMPMPVPDWIGVMQVAEKWGIEPDAVLHRPSYWVSRQLKFMAAESFVQAENAKKTS
jgi:hypothetical protein